MALPGAREKGAGEYLGTNSHTVNRNQRNEEGRRWNFI